jgi:O-antigen/teichoic acid export membrane protein
MSSPMLVMRLGPSLHRALGALMDRIQRWSLVLGKFLLVQIAVQVVGMLAGIIIVRTVTKEDYALYTIANTLLPALYALANSGVTFAASAIGGRVWQDDRRLGQVIVTALKASRILSMAVIALVLPLLAFLLRRNGASVAAIGMIAALVSAIALLQLGTAIFIVVPRLRGDFRFLQRTDLTVAVARLALVASAALAWLDTVVALLASALANLLQFLLVRSRVRRRVDLAVPADRSMEREMRGVAGRQWLNEVHYLLQGQISVFLLGVFGSTASVADFGALARIGLIFTAVGVSMQNIVLPRFARCQDPRRLAQLYLEILAANTVIAAAPVVAALLLPRPFLWLLGAQYMDLSSELVLVALSTATAVVYGISVSLNAVRAWIIPGWVVVPFSIVVEALLMLAIGVSTLQQVLWISILSNLLLTLLYVFGAVHFGRRFARTARGSDAGRRDASPPTPSSEGSE